MLGSPIWAGPTDALDRTKRFATKVDLCFNVVVLDMARATRPAVTLKPLFQEDLASLCNDFREIEVPCGSRRRIEPSRRARVIDKSHLTVKEPVENGGRTGQYERVQGTLARQRYES